MLLGILIFQLGHACRRYRKYKRNQRKLAEKNGNAEAEIHQKNCPKYSINHCLTRDSFLEEKTAKLVDSNFKRRSHVNDDDFDDMNMSDDSSNCEELDEDEGNIKFNFYFYFILNLHKFKHFII